MCKATDCAAVGRHRGPADDADAIRQNLVASCADGMAPIALVPLAAGSAEADGALQSFLSSAAPCFLLTALLLLSASVGGG